MPTNEEIREEYIIVMSGYEPKARGTKADREICLMNEARADTAEQIFKELELINKKTLYSNQKRVGSYIQIKKDDYIALKKKYNKEE